MRRPLGKWGAMAFSLGLLGFIYSRLDFRSFAERILNADPLWLGIAFLCFGPQIFVTTLRWRVMIQSLAPVDTSRALRMVMAAKALNALVPSKLGEMSKAYFLRKETGAGVRIGFPAVLLEKILDLGGLCFWMLLGIFLAPEIQEPMVIGASIGLGVLAASAASIVLPQLGLGLKEKFRGKMAEVMFGWAELTRSWVERPGRLMTIVSLSVTLWGLHMLQIYLFFPVLRQSMDVSIALAYIPLSLLAGLLPITLAGMGTRDAALILLFSPWADASTMAGVGLLCTMRYWSDTLMGVPFLHNYTAQIGREGEGEKLHDPGSQ